MNSDTYHKVLRVARYFFDLDISQMVDNLAYIIWNWIQRLWSFLVDTFHFLDLTKYIDENEISRDQNQNQNRDDGHNLNDAIASSRKLIRSIPTVISTYLIYIPLILEIWNMFSNPASIIRLWILGSFGITFLCIWSIVTDRSIVSSFICRVCGFDLESFNLDDVMRVSGFISICIGLILFAGSTWSIDILTCIVSLTVSNRIYRNIRSYLVIAELEC
jgi:hypothetical protein